jgi:hypothetical protein
VISKRDDVMVTSSVGIQFPPPFFGSNAYGLRYRN